MMIMMPPRSRSTDSSRAGLCRNFGSGPGPAAVTDAFGAESPFLGIRATRTVDIFCAPMRFRCHSERAVTECDQWIGLRCGSKIFVVNSFRKLQLLSKSLYQQR